MIGPACVQVHTPAVLPFFHPAVLLGSYTLFFAPTLSLTPPLLRSPEVRYRSLIGSLCGLDRSEPVDRVFERGNTFGGFHCMRGFVVTKKPCNPSAF